MTDDQTPPEQTPPLPDAAALPEDPPAETPAEAAPRARARDKAAPVPVLAVLGEGPGQPLAGLLRRAGVEVADAEPAPKQISEALAARFHFGTASVRAGRLGELRGLVQLVTQAQSLTLPKRSFWKQADASHVDGMRAEVDPCGLPDLAQAKAYRLAHLTALADLLRQTQRLVIVLDRVEVLIDPTDGTVFAAPPPGVATPKLCKLKPGRSTPEELETAFTALYTALKALSPELKLHLVVRPEDDPLGAALLAGLASGWAARLADVAHDPVLDHLIARLAAMPADHADAARLGAVIARLLAGEDLLEIASPAEGSAAPPPPETAEARGRRKDANRKEKRRARAKNRAGDVMCEDELLEAFSE